MNKATSQTVFTTMLCILFYSAAYGQTKQQEKPTNILPVISWWSSPTHFTPTPEQAARRQQFESLVKAAQDLLKAGKYGPAEITFNQALAATLNRTGWNEECWEGLAQAYTADGQIDKAIAAYGSLYNPPDGSGINSFTDDVTLLQYAMLLSQAGQADKAVTIYNRAVGFRNFTDGEQSTPVLFPEFGSSPTQIPYNASLLQGLAHAVLATRALYFDDAVAVSEAQQAAALAPNNAVVQFYVGSTLQSACRDANGAILSAAVQERNHAQAKAAFAKAVALDGGTVRVAARKAMR